MVRRGKKQERPDNVTNSPIHARVGVGAIGFDSQDFASGDRAERVQMFRKTKMCKFHILGMCAKGPMCRFAHDRTELEHLPDLSRTKLCKTLINTGSCEDPECRYAHSKEELRDNGPTLSNAPQSALPQTTPKYLGAQPSQHAPDQAAVMHQMSQMLQAGNVPMQPSQFQAMMLAIMQGQMQTQPVGSQSSFPGAAYTGMTSWPGQSMPQSRQGGLTNPQAEIGFASSDFSGDCGTPPTQFGPTPPLSRHGSSNNVNMLEHKPVSLVAAAQLLGAAAKHDSPGMQPANEPAHIPPMSLKSIKSSGSISSMLSGGGALDTVMEDDLRPMNTSWGRQLEETIEPSPYAIVGDSVQTEIDTQQNNGLRRSSGASGSFGSRLHTLAEEPAHIKPASLRSVGSGSALSAMVEEDLHVTQQNSDPDLLLSSFADSLSGNRECRVKNTFLEFPSRPQLAGLRQVHTYSGSLVDMG